MFCFFRGPPQQLEQRFGTGLINVLLPADRASKAELGGDMVGRLCGTGGGRGTQRRLRRTLLTGLEARRAAMLQTCQTASKW